MKIKSSIKNLVLKNCFVVGVNEYEGFIKVVELDKTDPNYFGPCK